MTRGIPNEDLLHAAGLTARRLTAADRSILLELLEADAAHFSHLYGRTPAEEVDDTFTGLPPGTTADDKFLYLFQAPDGQPVGMIDLVRGYPEPDIWYLGLIFLAPHHRGRGTGTALLKAIADWAASGGADRLRLGVLAGNPDAHRLYERLGFQNILVRDDYRAGNKIDRVFVMELNLRPEG